MMQDRDRKWILKKIKKDSKQAYLQIKKYLADLKKMQISYVDVSEIYKDLSLGEYFEENLDEIKVEKINLSGTSVQDKLLDGLNSYDLAMFAFVNGALKLKQRALAKLTAGQNDSYSVSKEEDFISAPINHIVVNKLFEHISPGD